MTAAQKTAKLKFKQAIAYRQKTGVSLKEAFAHIYGKKIANTRKLVFDYLEVPKGKVPKIVKVIGNIENATYKILGISIGFKKEIDKETGLYIIQVLDLSNNKKIIPISNNSDSKEVAYDLTEYIKYYTNTPTNIKSYGVLKKLEKLVPKIKKEVQNLNKKSTKMPIKNKVVKKKAAPKKKVAKKVVRKVVKKKVAPKKKVAKKKLTPRDYDMRYSAKKPGKRISTGKNYPYNEGNVYYESRPNRSDKGKLLGIGKVKTNLFNNLSDLKIFHKKEGGHWFDSQTMKYFNTKIESALLGGKYFIYSTKMPNYDRTFQIAEAYPSGNIFPVDNSPHFKDKTQAKIYLLKLLKL